jgi:phosphopantetheinyl transferase
MPLVLEQKKTNSSILIWELTEDLNSFKQQVPNDIFELIDSENRLKKRKLEKLSQVVLLQKLGIAYNKLEYLPNGKPILNNAHNISFSHSENISILLISTTNCGIDIEIASDKITRISSKFINQKERKSIKTKEEVYWAWTIKEAIFKYFGERVLFKEHINIIRINPELNNALVEYDGYNGKGIFNLWIEQIKNYYLAYTINYCPK